MDGSEIVVKRNKKICAVQIIKIVAGGVLSALIIILVLIFRRAPAFTHGKTSPLDLFLLFLILSGGLMVNGVKSYTANKKMPEIMLTCSGESFNILGEEVHISKIKGFKGGCQFGKTGVITVITEDKTYRLHGAADYAAKIRQLSELVRNYYKNANRD